MTKDKRTVVSCFLPVHLYFFCISLFLFFLCVLLILYFLAENINNTFFSNRTKTAFYNVIITLYVIIIYVPSFRLITHLHLYSYNLYMPGSRIYIIINNQLLIHVCLLSLLMTLLVCQFKYHLPVFIHGIS